MRLQYKLPKIDLDGVRRIFRHFGGHLRPHKTRLLISMLSMFGVSLVALLSPWPLKIVFDYILLPTNKASGLSFLAPLAGWDSTSILFLSVGSVLLLAVLGGILGYIQDIQAKTVGHGLAASIRLQVFAHAQRLPQSYHDYRETGDLMTRITGDITLIEELLVEMVIRMSGQLIQIIGILVLMFMLNWELALLILGIMPLFLLASLRFSTQIRSATRKQRAKYGKMVAAVQETFAGISQVKGFAQEKERDKIIGRNVDRDYKANLTTTRLSSNYARIVEIIAAVGTCLVLWLGVRKAIQGVISPGDLLIFLTYLRGVYKPIQGVARLSTRISKATARGEKVMEILEQQREVEDGEGAISAAGVRGDIRIENIGFAYGNNKTVLRDFTCAIPAGQTTLLLGPTGAGKSTIAKLLQRFYDPYEGKIMVDDRDIAGYRIRSLRKRVTSLSQETFLFRMSISENIAFSKPNATISEIEAAARLVGAHEFIQQLPQGYDTLVGEGGLTLSGGQRQRISFARAALRNSPIMIFDEPTTGLDARAEKGAKDALRALKPGKTLLIITHRLHFLDLADWVVFIRDGKLIEQGAPLDLLNKRDGFFKYVGSDKSYFEFLGSAKDNLPSEILE